MNWGNNYAFLDRLFLRAPFYSVEDYALCKMADVLKRQDFRNALWLASPEFCRVLEKQQFDWDKLGKKERLVLYKYYNRMSFRATPFGAFSSFALVPWTAGDQLRLVEADRSVLHLLPSREWQDHEEQKFKSSRADFDVRPNPTIRRVGNNLRFIRSLTGEKGKLTFLVNEVEAEELPLHLLELCRDNALSSYGVIARIAAMTACTQEEAADYYAFLVTEQLLLTSYEGCLIGDGGNNPFTGEEYKTWAAGQQLPFTKSLGLTAETDKPAQNDDGQIAFKGNMYYGGLERPLQQGGVGNIWQEELQSAITALRKLVIPYHTPVLKEFTGAFMKKFDGQKIMLLDAIDPDKGVDYGNLHAGVQTGVLLKDIAFPVSRPKAPMEWTVVHRLFFRLWQNNAFRSPADAITVNDEDLDELPQPAPGFLLPPSLAMLFTRTRGKLVLENNGGASATALTGRFSVFSSDVEELCREIAREESKANPEVVFAELHQLSDTHVDNINRRRPVYDHVIHINTYPAETGQLSIALSDLLLYVHGEELILESVSLGKRVIPRLPTAYNFHHNELSLFRFLGDLQFQGLQANLTFDLEKLFPGLPFYPRVEYRRTILSLAKWRLDKEDTNALISGSLSIGRLHLLRQERGIPRCISLGQSDQQLVFDLADDAEALFFLECLKEQPNALIREHLPPDGSVTAGKSVLGAQLIALLKNMGPVYRGITENGAKKTKKIKRAFLPGSNWIYLKIYCTAESADTLLLRLIKPFIESNRQQVMSWFFIRYEDPDPHIRLRMLAREGDYEKLLRGLHARLSEKTHIDLVRLVQQDTYEREIERYSAELMELVEDHFYMGSRMALTWIDLKTQEAGANGFDLAVAKLVYGMASAFLTGEEALAAFFQWRSGSFIREFGGEKLLRMEFDRKYRALSKELSAVMGKSGVLDSVYEQMGESRTFLENMDVLREQTANWPEEKRLALIADLMHMQVNRLFPGMQRRREGLICHCLYKYAASVSARSVRV